LPAAQSSQNQHRLPPSQRGNRDRRRIFKIDAFRFQRDGVRFGHRVFGVTTGEGGKGHPINRIALLEIFNLNANLFNGSGDVAAKNERKFEAEHFAHPIADFPVRRIDPRDVNFHQNLVHFRRWTRHIGIPQNALITVFVNHYCFHFSPIFKWIF